MLLVYVGSICVNIIVDMEKLGLLVLDDDLGTLRGLDLFGLKQHREKRKLVEL